MYMFVKEPIIKPNLYNYAKCVYYNGRFVDILVIMALTFARRLMYNGCRSLYTTSKVNMFYETPDKDGQRRPSEEELEFEKLSFKDKIKNELQLWKEELKYLYVFTKDHVTTDPYMVYRENEVDVIWNFTGDPKDLKKWIVTADSDQDLGFSSANLEFTQDCKGLFHGYLDTRIPDDGRIKNTGFCNLRTVAHLKPFKIKSTFDWGVYTHIVLKVRGDGRVYAINLHTDRQFDVQWYDTYHFFIWTRGGPYWQTVRIPFSRFCFAYKGRIQPKQEKVATNEIAGVSITIADKITGPFHFEIDWIGVVNDPGHFEESAYELYNVDDPKVWL